MPNPQPPAAVTPALARTWFVYLLECQGGYLYIGITPDVAARYALHCAGRGAAFTRINKPLRILAAMPSGSRSAATRLELGLKKLPRHQKLRWAEQWPWPSAGPG